MSGTNLTKMKGYQEAPLGMPYTLRYMFDFKFEYICGCVSLFASFKGAQLHHS